jgi:hypothetical protein
VQINDGYRYPRHNGRQIAYLTEPEIACAYRQRFAGLQSRMEAAVSHEEYRRVRLDRQNAVVAVTPVPDLDGYAEIDAARSASSAAPSSPPTR